MENECPKCNEPYENHICYWSPCKGCPEGHSSFWKTIVESEEWESWRVEQDKRMSEYKDGDVRIFDVPESEETGNLSPQHWKEFVSFLRKNGD